MVLKTSRRGSKACSIGRNTPSYAQTGAEGEARATAYTYQDDDVIARTREQLVFAINETVEARHCSRAKQLARKPFSVPSLSNAANVFHLI